jgi:cobalamin biosynthesis protein CbiD
MPKRTVTIESPQGNTLRVQVEAEVVDKFVKAATDKRGSFRGKDETFQHAIESAVTVTLAKAAE